VTNAIATHIAIQIGRSTRYGDRRRLRHRSANGWIINQNKGMVE
jgi:hypothetical protein